MSVFQPADWVTPLLFATLESWVHLAARSLELVYQELLRQIGAFEYLQCDETPVDYIEPGHGRTKTGYLWTLHRPRGPTVYHWFPSRAADCLRRLLPSQWTGILQTDGYAAYPAHAHGRPITLVACWAHARRKFYSAGEHEPRVYPVLGWIGQLYQLEHDLRGTEPADRAAVRQEQAGPVLNQIHHWLLDHGAAFLPKSDAGKAVAYTLGLWPQLQAYVNHGHLEIDNNLVENAIRPTAVGKKNWLFIGAEGAGQSSAIPFTLVQECRRLGINPQDYFTLALARIPTATNRTVAELTPEALAPILRAGPQPARVQAA